MGKFLGLLALTLILAVPAKAANIWGVDVPGLELQFGYDLVLNSIQDSASNPVFSNSVGMSVPFVIIPDLVFRPETSVFFLPYQFQSGRAVPVEPDLYDSVTVMSLMLNADFAYEFHPIKTLWLTTEAGLAFTLRFPIFVNGTNAGDMVLPITGWFIAGRFLYPNLSLGVLYQFSDRYTLFARFQCFGPLSNLWDNQWVDFEPWNGIIIGLNVGVRFAI